jgi:hypothetical protein
MQAGGGGGGGRGEGEGEGGGRGRAGGGGGGRGEAGNHASGTKQSNKWFGYSFDARHRRGVFDKLSLMFL